MRKKYPHVLIYHNLYTQYGLPKIFVLSYRMPSKYKLVYLVRNTLTKDGGSLLRFPLPCTQKVWDHYERIDTSKLPCKAYHMLIRKLSMRKKYMISNYTTSNILKKKTKNKVAVLVVLIFVNMFKSIENRTFWFI